MSSNRNTFRLILEPLEDRVVPAMVARPWGEWSPIYQTSVVMQQNQEPLMHIPRQVKAAQAGHVAHRPAVVTQIPPPKMSESQPTSSTSSTADTFES